MQMFQRALVELTLAPGKARALREGKAGVLDNFELTDRERERLMDVVRQPGVSVSCSLSRGNRLEVIFGTFPMTCVLLRHKLRRLLDELWEKHQPTNYQLAGEETAFAELLAWKIGEGKFSIEYLEEVFAYEMVCMELSRQLRQKSEAKAEIEAVVEFKHPPRELLGPLSRMEAPPSGLPVGSRRMLVKLHGGRFHIEELPSSSR